MHSTITTKPRQAPKTHKAKLTLRRRHDTPEAEAAYALYELERRRFGRRGQGLITAEFARRALKRFHYQSAISGETSEKLRLRRFWPDRDLSDWNVVALTLRENRAIGHTKNWLACYPPVVVERMQAHRDVDDDDRLHGTGVYESPDVLSNVYSLI
jgi:hypothetical protein